MYIIDCFVHLLRKSIMLIFFCRNRPHSPVKATIDFETLWGSDWSTLGTLGSSGNDVGQLVQDQKLQLILKVLDEASSLQFYYSTAKCWVVLHLSGRHLILRNVSWGLCSYFRVSLSMLFYGEPVWAKQVL